MVTNGVVRSIITAQKGLKRDTIVAQALELIAERGRPEISMRELAERLQIKTPSLYNHVKSLDDLLTSASECAAARMKELLFSAKQGKYADAAVYAVADAYRRFAKEQKGLYRLVMSSSGRMAEDGHPVAEAMVAPLVDLLSAYALDAERAIHWQRVLRSIMHGFVSLEEAGFFQRAAADAYQSYHLAIHAFLCGLREENGANGHA